MRIVIADRGRLLLFFISFEFRISSRLQMRPTIQSETDIKDNRVSNTRACVCVFVRFSNNLNLFIYEKLKNSRIVIPLWLCSHILRFACIVPLLVCVCRSNNQPKTKYLIQLPQLCGSFQTLASIAYMRYSDQRWTLSQHNGGENWPHSSNLFLILSIPGRFNRKSDQQLVVACRITFEKWEEIALKMTNWVAYLMADPKLK